MAHATSSPAAGQPPRNLLFIVADQFRADLLDGGLAKLVPTPNLDRLAAQSMCYQNHHTVTVPCGPSRASLLTGQYAMSHGSARNGTPLARHHPTLASEMRKIGREPLLFGYTDTQADPSGLHPNDPARVSYTAPAPGFNEVQEMREESWAWLAYLRAKGYDVPDADAPDFMRLYRPEGGVPGGKALYQAEDSDTAFLTNRTLAELDIRKSKPWHALITYIRPHPPYVAPAPYDAMFSPEDMPNAVPQSFDHPFFDATFARPSQTDMFWGFDGNQAALREEDVARTRATYFGLVAELDHHIGRLLDWLDQTGQTDDTLVVFTADHGEMLGDHDHWGKVSPFRPASHIPLFLRGPGIAAGTYSQPTESTQLTPTLLSMMGGTPVPAMRTALLGEAQYDPCVMVEMELGDPSGSGLVEEMSRAPTAYCRACVLETSDWRYVHFANGFPPMLFDLSADPACCDNIADALADVVSNMQVKLLNRRMAFGHPEYL